MPSRNTFGGSLLYQFKKKMGKSTILIINCFWSFINETFKIYLFVGMESYLKSNFYYNTPKFYVSYKFYLVNYIITNDKIFDRKV